MPWTRPALGLPYPADTVGKPRRRFRPPKWCQRCRTRRACKMRRQRAPSSQASRGCTRRCCFRPWWGSPSPRGSASKPWSPRSWSSFPRCKRHTWRRPPHPSARAGTPRRRSHPWRPRAGLQTPRRRVCRRLRPQPPTFPGGTWRICLAPRGRCQRGRRRRKRGRRPLRPRRCKCLPRILRKMR